MKKISEKEKLTAIIIGFLTVLLLSSCSFIINPNARLIKNDPNSFAISVSQMGKCVYQDGNIAKFEISYTCSTITTKTCTREVETNKNVGKYIVGKYYTLTQLKK